MIGGIIDKVSRFKVLQIELERRLRESAERHIVSLEREVRQVPQVGEMSTHMYGPIKPPSLKLIHFSGDVLKWKEFWNAFEASIDKVKYVPIDKLNHLKSKFKGEALEASSGYQLLNENYVAVLESLKRRYGNQ